MTGWTVITVQVACNNTRNSERYKKLLHHYQYIVNPGNWYWKITESCWEGKDRVHNDHLVSGSTQRDIQVVQEVHIGQDQVLTSLADTLGHSSSSRAERKELVPTKFLLDIYIRIEMHLYVHLTRKTKISSWTLAVFDKVGHSQSMVSWSCSIHLDGWECHI